MQTSFGNQFCRFFKPRALKLRKYFKNLNNLKLHSPLTLHQPLTMTKCDLCNKNGFKGAKGLAQHKRQVHPVVPPENPQIVNLQNNNVEIKQLKKTCTDFTDFITNLINSFASQYELELNSIKAVLNKLNPSELSKVETMPAQSPNPPIDVETPWIEAKGSKQSQTRQEFCVNLTNRFAVLQEIEKNAPPEAPGSQKYSDSVKTVTQHPRNNPANITIPPPISQKQPPSTRHLQQPQSIQHQQPPFSMQQPQQPPTLHQQQPALILQHQHQQPGMQHRQSPSSIQNQHQPPLRMPHQQPSISIQHQQPAYRMLNPQQSTMSPNTQHQQLPPSIQNQHQPSSSLQYQQQPPSIRQQQQPKQRQIDQPSRSQNQENSENTLLIMGDSNIHGVRPRELAQRIREKVFVHKQAISGATASHICYYSDILLKDKPNSVIIHAGTNDLVGRNSDSNLSADNIACDLIRTGVKARNAGVKHVMISSLLPINDFHANKKAQEVNNHLREHCHTYNFIYINNSNLTKEDLGDTVHLSNEGKKVLMDNFAYYVNRY